MSDANDWCKHYRAMAFNDTCEIGIAYESVRANKTPGLPFPCVSREYHTCPAAVYPTPEECAAHDAEIAAFVTKFATDLESDICPHCGQKIEHWKQIGRCVYAEPCGDRLYQGQVPKGKLSHERD